MSSPKEPAFSLNHQGDYKQQRLDANQVKSVIGEFSQALRPQFNLTNLSPLRQGSNLVLVDRQAAVVVKVYLEPNLAEEVGDQLGRIANLRQEGLPFLRPILD